jgi:GAF domain-containing protein
MRKKKYLALNINDILRLKIDYQQVLEAIANVALHWLDLEICLISLVDYKTGKLQIGALTGFGEFEREYKKIFDISLSDRAITTNCIVMKKQIQYENILDKACPFKYKKFAQKMGIKSILVTPIFEENKDGSEKTLGTLNFYTRYHHKFHGDELELAKIIASGVAEVITRGTFEQEGDESRKMLKIIEQIDSEMNKNTNNPGKIFKLIVEGGIKLVGADRGCLKLCHESFISREFHQKCDNVLCSHENYRYPDITNYVVRNKKGVIIDDIDSFPYKDPKIKYKNTNSRISVPLILGDNVIGVLTAEHREKNHFNVHHLQLFETLAKQAVIAITNMRRNKHLKKKMDSQLIIKKLTEETSKLEATKDGEKQRDYSEKQLEQVIEDTIKKTGETFDAVSGFVALADPNSDYAIRNTKWQFGLPLENLPTLEVGFIEGDNISFKEERWPKIFLSGAFRTRHPRYELPLNRV